VPRLCLDLNVLVADLLAAREGRTGTAASAVVDAVRRGECPLGPVALVISWGMLGRLEQVLCHKLGIEAATAQARCRQLARYARHGPSLTLGGTGVLPLRDVEDQHVLETALAGRADWLVTADFRDFAEPFRTRTPLRVMVPGRLAVHDAADGRRLLIAHPATAAAWLRDPDAWRGTVTAL
jgi:hypothetical protein